MPLVRIGTASPASGATTEATLIELARLARHAAAAGAHLLLLPEAYLGGYPRGTTFGCAVGSRTDAGREEFAAYFEDAVDLGDTAGMGGGGAGDRWLRRQLGGDKEGGSTGPGEAPSSHRQRGDGTREKLEAVARDTGVFLVTGCIEKAGGSLYCAVLYVCPREGVIGKRRKVMPTGAERLIWAQGSPSTLRAVSTTLGGARVNLAAAICWENYMPLLRQSLYAQNVNLYLAPTADGRDAWLSLMRTIAIEGRCFVASSNMCVRERPVLQSQRRRRCRRRSVLDDDGNEIVLHTSDDEEIDPRALTREKDWFSKEDGEAAFSKEQPGEHRQMASRGGSCIISPFGDVMAGPQWDDDEGIIYADLDLRDCIKGRLDIDTAGSYSRSDAFKLTVEGLDLDPLSY